MSKNDLAVATLLVAGMGSLVFADDPKAKTVAEGEKSKASPGWVVIEEDWSYPFLYGFSTALHEAREPYRAKEDRSASAEIDIDHHEARIYRSERHGSVPQQLVPYDPHGFGRHLRSEKPETDGERQPARKSFYQAIAKTLRDADRTLIFGSGTGESSAMDKLIAELGHNHGDLAKLVVGSVVIDANHPTGGELLAKARGFSAPGHEFGRVTVQVHRGTLAMDAEKLDGKILRELKLELRRMPGVDRRNVAVKATVKTGVAILFGHVSHPSVRRVAEQVARRVIGVRSAVNEIKLHHPAGETEQDLGHSRSAMESFAPEQQGPARVVRAIPRRNDREKAHCLRPGRHPGPEQSSTR